MEISRQIVKGQGTAWREKDKSCCKGVVLEWGGSTKTRLKAFDIFTDSLYIYTKIKKTKHQKTNQNKQKNPNPKPQQECYETRLMWWIPSAAESWRVLLALSKLWVSQAEIPER